MCLRVSYRVNDLSWSTWVFSVRDSSNLMRSRKRCKFQPTVRWVALWATFALSLLLQPPTWKSTVLAAIPFRVIESRIPTRPFWKNLHIERRNSTFYKAFHRPRRRSRSGRYPNDGNAIRLATYILLRKISLPCIRCQISTQPKAPVWMPFQPPTSGSIPSCLLNPRTQAPAQMPDLPPRLSSVMEIISAAQTCSNYLNPILRTQLHMSVVQNAVLYLTPTYSRSPVDIRVLQTQRYHRKNDAESDF